MPKNYSVLHNKTYFFFDFDGVIANSTQKILTSISTLFPKHHAKDKYFLEKFKGLNRFEIAQLIITTFYDNNDEARFTLILKEINCILDSTTKNSSPVPGFIQFVQTIKKNGGLIYIISKAKKNRIVSFLTQHQLEIIDNIFICDKSDKSAVLRESIRKINCKREQAVLFGDSFSDREAADTVGIEYIEVQITDKTSTFDTINKLFNSYKK